MGEIKHTQAIRLIISRIKELETKRDQLIKKRDEHSTSNDYLTSRAYNDFAKQLANVEDAIQHNKKILYGIR